LVTWNFNEFMGRYLLQTAQRPLIHVPWYSLLTHSPSVDITLRENMIERLILFAK
jgi:hypothetical protein